ncbi:MAG: TraR/DksA family transcriptional regulator [Akkermansia sp.]
MSRRKPSPPPRLNWPPTEWEPFVQMRRQHLMDLRDRALDNMSGVARDTLRNHPEGSEASGSGEHQADAGSDAYDRDFALSLLSKEQDGLYEIEQALARIDNGTYGIVKCHTRSFPSCGWRPFLSRGSRWNARPSGKRKKGRTPGSAPEWPWALREDKMM